MVCLASLDHVNVYRCVGFKRKFSAPTEHVFSVKHPRVQTFKSKHICCMCAETAKLKETWIQMIRMGKYGYRLYEDYTTTQRQLESLLLPPTLNNNNSGTFGGGERVKKRSTDQMEAPDRLLGKQNTLGEIFSSAWRKGDARIQRAREMSGRGGSSTDTSSGEESQ